MVEVPPPVDVLDSVLFFFSATATTEIYTLSLHDALPISVQPASSRGARPGSRDHPRAELSPRSEEHTSELQSQSNLVCRLLLEKKKQTPKETQHMHLLTLRGANTICMPLSDPMIRRGQLA